MLFRSVETPIAFVIAAETGFRPTAIIAGNESTEAPPANPLRKPTVKPTKKIARISTISELKNSLIYSRNEEDFINGSDCIDDFKPFGNSSQFN